MIRIERYNKEKKQEWDNFVRASKNGTFLFLRDYMDYHSDRFHDHSLLYYNEKGKLIALLPANERDNSLFSHKGLTYGGLVLLPKTHISDVGELFENTISYLHGNGLKDWHYKQMPSVYHKLPAEEDTYWLWRHNARQVACNMMTAIDLQSDINILSGRKLTYFNKLQRSGFTVNMNADINSFWHILEDNLMERFHAKPVHSLQEITMLSERFPENITCCTVLNSEGNTLAGTILFISDRVVRTQYISASHEGKKCNALDFLMLTLVRQYKECQNYRYLEFGTSMDEDGINLNEGLILQKEGFGGRSIACQEYVLNCY